MMKTNKKIFSQRTKKRIIELSEQTKSFIKKPIGETMQKQTVKVNMILRTIKDHKINYSVEVPYNEDKNSMISEAKNQAIKSLQNSPWQVASVGEVTISKA